MIETAEKNIEQPGTRLTIIKGGRSLAAPVRTNNETKQEVEMPQSLGRVIVHLVFGTKNRIPWFDEPFCREIEAYVTGILANLGCPPVAVGFVEQHGHMGFLLSRSLALATVVREIKVSSSKWIKGKGASYRDFAWQGGYGVFSVNPAKLDDLVKYIQGQRGHHQTERFQDELPRLLSTNGAEFDVRYLWD